jgi:hypothetical protein
MERNSKPGKWSSSLTPATGLLSEKLGIPPETRRLTPSEIALLRQSKREIARRFTENQAHRKVTRAALENPDLPDSFTAESLMSMADQRENSLPFVPRGQPTDC